MPPPYALFRSPSAPGSGMGANLLAGGGCSFRVWAPNANAVVVRLRPDGGSGYNEIPMTQDGQGSEYWSVDVGGVALDERYRFLMTNRGGGGDNPGGKFEHVDPYARDVEHSGLKADG